MAAPTEYASLLDEAAAELRRNVAAAQGAAGALVERLLAVGSTGHIIVFGVGREGLAMEGFAMRLYHMGLQVRVRADGGTACRSASTLRCACCPAIAAQPHSFPRQNHCCPRMCTGFSAGGNDSGAGGPGRPAARFGGARLLQHCALCGAAESAGAATVALTSQPATAAVQRALGAGTVLHLPATCMAAAGELAGEAAAPAPMAAAPQRPSPLLLGSSYELALQLLLDIVCVQLVRRLQLSPEQLAARHTNLE